MIFPLAVIILVALFINRAGFYLLSAGLTVAPVSPRLGSRSCSTPKWSRVTSYRSTGPVC